MSLVAALGRLFRRRRADARFVAEPAEVLEVSPWPYEMYTESWTAGCWTVSTSLMDEVRLVGVTGDFGPEFYDQDGRIPPLPLRRETMTDSMVERVARAMCGGAPWDGVPEVGKDVWRLHARAAIEAMREPTEEMLDAADGRVNMGSDSQYEQISQTDIKAAWCEMITRALAEPPCRLHAETYGDLLPPVPK